MQVEYEVMVFKRWFNDEDRADRAAGHARVHKSIIKADGYEDAQRIVAALNATGKPQDDEERWCQICVRVWLANKTVLVPVHHINSNFIDTMQHVFRDVNTVEYNSTKPTLKLKPKLKPANGNGSADFDEFKMPGEDHLQRAMRSFDEVDQQF